jgi:cobalt-zinc-cadmium efflux system membrane fusion protein
MRLEKELVKTISIKVIFLVFLLIFAFACNKSSNEGEKKGKENEAKNDSNAVNITVGKTVAQQLPAYIQTTGSFTADESSDVSSKVAGKVVNLYANVGDFVEKGKIIAKIDDKDARLRVQEAESAVRQAEAGVKQAEVRAGLGERGNFDSLPEVRVAKTNIEQLQIELKQAEANEKRYRELVESGDVAMIQYETYRTARDTARSRVKTAREQLDTVINNAKVNNQSIKTAQASVENAKVQVVTAKEALKDYVVYAPMSGFVSNRPIAVGEFVSSSTPILTVLRVNPIKAQIQISEADVSEISVGRGVSVEVDAYKDRKFSGTIKAINPALNVNSRSAIVEAEIENNENLLRQGMFATARITKDGSSRGVFAPKSAVYNDQATQSYRVFVIEEGIAKLKTVQIGQEENDMIQLLSGVDADQMVATSNLDKLFEGAKVVF